MSAVEKALTQLHEVESRSAATTGLLHTLDPRSKILVTVGYLAAVLSFSLTSLSGILLFAVYPLVGSAMAGLTYSRLLRQSLPALPFIIFIGIFNPLLDHEPMLRAGSLVISRGWIELISIVARGLLSVQAVVLLITTTGFHRVCRGLRALGVPALFTTQLLLVYRYIHVLAEEALSMERARLSRSYGRRSFGLRMWATFIGQLLLRTVARAERIHRAMLARGFNGALHTLTPLHWRTTDTLFMLSWLALFAAGRFCDLSHFIHFAL